MRNQKSVHAELNLQGNENVKKRAFVELQTDHEFQLCLRVRIEK